MRSPLSCVLLSGVAMAMLVASCSAEAPERTGTAQAALSTGLVISQVYGGGGNSGATYDSDFIELFNRGATPVALGGLSVQYGLATSTGDFSSVVALSAVSVQPGEYYLVKLASGATGIPLPTPDQVGGSVNMSATAGKVALVNGTTAITCEAGVCNLAGAIDLVGYGATANQFEGSGPATTAPTAASSVQRRGAGCTETDDNLADFENPALAVNPRTSASSAHDCSGGGLDAATEAAPTSDAGDAGAVQDSSTDADLEAATDADLDAGGGDAGADAVVGPDGGGDAATGNTLGLVISQLYGGGGNSGATFKSDFVELFNRGAADVELGGLSVQYASSTGVFQPSNVTVLQSATIPAGHYFLVELASGGATGSPLPASDQVNTGTNLSATAGKVAIVKGTTGLACGSADGGCPTADFVDLVGYGGGTSQFEGSAPATGPSNNTESVARRLRGCIDTDDNLSDFEKPPVAAAPRNSATAFTDCAALEADAGSDAGSDAAGADAAGPKDSGAPGDSGSVVEAGGFDAAPPADSGAGIDATTPGDGGEDSGAGGFSQAPAGCSCRLGGSQSTGAGWPLALLAVATALGARRRPR